MNFAMLKAFLTHRIAAKAMAQNTDPRFGLAASILALTKSLFFKTLLKLPGVARRNCVEDIFFLEIFLIVFTIETAITGDKFYINTKICGNTLMAALK